MRKVMLSSTIALALVAASVPAWSQRLPPASRTVFKCEADGKVVYSDAPCLGAKRVDVEPTRGMSRMSGQERVGSDVRRERVSEQIAEAYKPIFGENAQQRATRHRRAKLSADARGRCGRLDREVLAGEAHEAKAEGEELGRVQKRLLRLRKAQQALGC